MKKEFQCAYHAVVRDLVLGKHFEECLEVGMVDHPFVFNGKAARGKMPIAAHDLKSKPIALLELAAVLGARPQIVDRYTPCLLGSGHLEVILSVGCLSDTIFAYKKRSHDNHDMRITYHRSRKVKVRNEGDKAEALG